MVSSSERAVQVLVKTDPEFVELCKALYGPVIDADEIWSDVFGKRAPSRDPEKMKQRVATASNAVGLAAGAAAIGSSLRDDRINPNKKGAQVGPVGRALYRVGSKIPKSKVLAAANKNKRTAAALGAGAGLLQLGNVAGDVVVSRTLPKPGAPKSVRKDIGGLPPLKNVVAGVQRQKQTQVKAMLKPTGNKINATTSTATPTRSGAVGAPGVTPPPGVGGGSAGVTPGQAGLSKRAPSFVAAGEFSKFDDDQRLAFGWASVVEKDGMPVIDRQGDYISADDMEKAAYVYVEKSRVGGDMHKRAGFAGERPHHVADLVESMVFTKEKIAKMGLPESTPVGWWVGFRVNDEQVWESVKKGGHTGFSIHGKGKRLDTTLDDVVGY